MFSFSGCSFRFPSYICACEVRYHLAHEVSCWRCVLKVDEAEDVFKVKAELETQRDQVRPAKLSPSANKVRHVEGKSEWGVTS